MNFTALPKVISVSRLISNFFNPITSLFIYYLYFSWKNYNFNEDLERFLPILIITIIPISLWIFYHVKTGKYSNWDVSNRNQRKSLYFFIAGSLVVYLVYFYLITQRVDLVMMFILILLLFMQLSNYFIKSSMHTAFNVFTAALFFSQNIALGLVWLFIAILVGATRVILNRHSVNEVLMGFFLAALVSFPYLYVSTQTQNHL